MMTSPQPAVTHDQLKRAVAHALCNHDPVVSDGKRKNSHNYTLCIERVSPYATATLQRLLDAAGTQSGLSLYNLLTMNHQPEKLINDWCAMLPVINENKLMKYEVLSLLNALPHYRHLTPYDSEEYPDSRRTQIIAIARVTLHLIGIGLPVATPDPNNSKSKLLLIPDKSLRDLITGSDDPQRLADLIIERSVTDPATVTALLSDMNSAPDPLQTGTL